MIIAAVLILGYVIRLLLPEQPPIDDTEQFARQLEALRRIT